MIYEKSRNKIIKKIGLYMLIGTILWISGCGNGKAKSGVNSYDELKESQQEIVDGVYDAYSSWKSVHDSGKDFPCTNVTFFKEDGKMIFATYYRARSDYGFVKYFEVNMENGELSGHSYSIFGDKAQIKENVAQVKAATGTEFSADSDESTMKDILASTYYKAFSE